MQLYINKNGQQLGPYTVAQARDLAAAGTVAPTDWVWYEGLTDWIPLSQVPGFAASSSTNPLPAPLPTVPFTPPARVVAPSAAPAATPARRTVLVWIICLFYFIVTPITVVYIAASPYLFSSAMIRLSTADAGLERAMYRTSDPATHDRLLKIQTNLRGYEKKIARLLDHNILYIFIGELMALLHLGAAITLFRLERIALKLFIAAFAVELGHQIFNGVFTGPFNLSLIFVTGGWIINILAISYAWHLSRKGVLS